MFVGYNLISTRDRLYDPETDSILASCDDVFDEVPVSKGVSAFHEKPLVLGDPFATFFPP